MGKTGNTEQDERGNTYYGIDEDIRDRLRSHLMRVVLSRYPGGVFFSLPGQPSDQHRAGEQV